MGGNWTLAFFPKVPARIQRAPSHRWDSLYACLIYDQGRNCLIMCTADDLEHVFRGEAVCMQ